MITILAYISCLFVMIQLFNLALNIIFRQNLKKYKLGYETNISILIPARNEENNIGNLLNKLCQIHDQGLEILVFDDQSEDNTAKIVQTHSNTDSRIRLISSGGLPDGWAGKNYACYQLAKEAKGQFYLFLDADVTIEGDVVSNAIAYMKDHKIKLLSIFPKQIYKTMGEELSVPIMNYILLSLLPLIFVRISPFKSHSAANGQFMLFDAEVYQKIQAHKLFKNSVVEDISIAAHFKKNKIKIACLTHENRVKCRMYNSYNSARKGFSKNVFMFFGNKAFFAFAFWTIVSFGFIPVLQALPDYLGFYFAGIIISLILYAYVSMQNIFLSVVLFPAHLFFLLQVLINGLRVKTKKHIVWKGRYIQS
jgi:glycosyltransferase involved in cell wall biosynthesis